VSGAAFSPDETKVLACGGSDGLRPGHTLVRVYDVLTGKLLYVCGRSETALFPPDGSMLQFVGRGESKCMIWQLEHRLESSV